MKIDDLSKDLFFILLIDCVEVFISEFLILNHFIINIYI